MSTPTLALSLQPYALRIGYCLSNGEILSVEQTGEKVHESAPKILLDRIKQDLGDRWTFPGGLIFCSGPGSYTGLRIVLSFLKGLGSAWSVPLIKISFFELSFLHFQDELQSSDSVHVVEYELGKGRSLVASGSSREQFLPEHWKEMGSDEALILLQEADVGYRLKGEKYVAGEIFSDTISFERMALQSKVQNNLLSKVAAGPQQLALIHPDYGITYKALTVSEQRDLRAIEAKGVEGS